jgi:hypothetical protein
MQRKGTAWWDVSHHLSWSQTGESLCVQRLRPALNGSQLHQVCPARWLYPSKDGTSRGVPSTLAVWGQEFESSQLHPAIGPAAARLDTSRPARGSVAVSRSLRRSSERRGGSALPHRPRCAPSGCLRQLGVAHLHDPQMRWAQYRSRQPVAERPALLVEAAEQRFLHDHGHAPR